MGDEKNEQQRSADGPTARTAKRKPHSGTADGGNNKPGAARAGDGFGESEELTACQATEQRSQTVFEEQEDEKANDGRSGNADVLQHLAEFEALL